MLAKINATSCNVFLKMYTVCMSSLSNSLTDKQLAKYNRQKCINLLEKITKNLFRMFRNKETTKKQITDRFFHLKEKLDLLWDVHLDTEYHREMRKYIENIANRFTGHFDLDEIREKNMSALNRIQKLKNAISYKRQKHVQKYL